MALRGCASFDYSTSGTVTDWPFGTTSGNSYSQGTGRNGTAAFTVIRGNAWVEHIFDAQSTWIIGVAVNTRTSTTQNGIIAILDGATVHGTLVISNNSDDKLRYYRGNETTLLATGSTALSKSTFHYIELKVFISDTAGTIDIVVDGVAETLTYASGSNGTQDTRNAGNATADRIRIGGMNVNNVIARDFDDIYVCDGTGSSPTNTFLGDVRIQYRTPSGNGTTSNLVGSDGNSTDNYLLVDETSPNDDTDYVQSSTVGDKDTYAIQDLTPTSGTVYGVKAIAYAKKDDAGVRKFSHVMRLSGTEVDSATESSLTTTYAFYSDLRETKPTSGSWSISDVNNLEVGVKVTT